MKSTCRYTRESTWPSRCDKDDKWINKKTINDQLTILRVVLVLGSRRRSYAVLSARVSIFLRGVRVTWYIEWEISRQPRLPRTRSVDEISRQYDMNNLIGKFSLFTSNFSLFSFSLLFWCWNDLFKLCQELQTSKNENAHFKTKLFLNSTLPLYYHRLTWVRKIYRGEFRFFF